MDSNRPDELKRRVEGHINDLIRHLEAQTGPVPEEVKDWWMMHYRSKFYYAIDFKGRVFSDDRTALEAKAHALGTALRDIAKSQTPTRDHAAQASFQVDCPEDKRPGTFVDWCN